METVRGFPSLTWQFFSGRYFIRNVPWVVQTRQTPSWCLSSSHAPQAGGFFYYAPPRVTPLLETG